MLCFGRQESHMRYVSPSFKTEMSKQVPYFPPRTGLPSYFFQPAVVSIWDSGDAGADAGAHVPGVDPEIAIANKAIDPNRLNWADTASDSSGAAHRPHSALGQADRLLLQSNSFVLLPLHKLYPGDSVENGGVLSFGRVIGAISHLFRQ